MGKQVFTFLIKNRFVILLIGGILLGISNAYVHAQVEPEDINSGIKQDEVYEVWLLATRYKFEVVPSGYDQELDSKNEMIASLRGDNLRNFLDFIEAVNQAQNTVFPPSSPNSKPPEIISVTEEKRLVEMVLANVFDAVDYGDSEDLNELEWEYVLELQTILETIIEGDEDKVFSEKYLNYRRDIILFIEDTDIGLFTPSQRAVKSYLEYFDIENEQSIDLDPNPTLAAGCSVTNTIDNWPSKSTVFSGNTGSSWHDGIASDQTDCDIWVRYYMGSTPHYGIVSANTSDAQCVLDKTAQLRGDWTGNFNNVQYGRNTVTWWWPLGCNTTGNSLRAGTKWRP